MREFKNLNFKNKFDFEVGYLRKSPCKTCNKKHESPRCFENCLVIDQIQTFLIGVLHCNR